MLNSYLPRRDLIRKLLSINISIQPLNFQTGPILARYGPTSTDSTDITSVTSSSTPNTTIVPTSTPPNTPIPTTSVTVVGVLTSRTRTTGIPPSASDTQMSSKIPQITSSVNSKTMPTISSVSMYTGATMSSSNHSSITISAYPSKTSTVLTHTSQHIAVSIASIATGAVVGTIAIISALAFIYWRRRGRSDTVHPLRNGLHEVITQEPRRNRRKWYTLGTAMRRQAEHVLPYTLAPNLQPSLAFGTNFMSTKRLWADKDRSTARRIQPNAQDASLIPTNSRAAPIHEDRPTPLSQDNTPLSTNSGQQDIEYQSAEMVNNALAAIAELRGQLLHMKMRSTPAPHARNGSEDHDTPPSYVSENICNNVKETDGIGG